MTEPRPWDRHADLSQERLSTLALAILRVRDDALLTHEPHKGDGPWGYGCRALERQIDAIKKLAETESWLTILEDGRHFVFRVGQVPVRFYKGRAGKPKVSTLRQNHPELTAQQLAFKFVDDRHGLWRLAIETDVTGRVSRIVAVEVAVAGKPGNERVMGVLTSWEIPLGESVSAVGSVTPMKREGKQLDKPKVRPKAKGRTKKDGTTDGGA
jgi:hypothetical protein